MQSERVLIVGTTSDYVGLIARRFPGRAIFLTDTAERAAAREPDPPACDEVRCDLSSTEEAIAALRAHTIRWDIRISGVACFDCESLSLAADTARRMSLPFPSSRAILSCRDKYECKKLWRAAGLPAPEAVTAESASEAEAFLRRMGRSVVVKPIAGSGSEYLFKCADAGECRAACETLRSKLAGLRADRHKPLYSRDRSGKLLREGFVVEEFVEGPEYSCDFVVENGEAAVLRVARKIPAHGLSFGTTLAYAVPSDLPPGVDRECFRRQLACAAGAVGLERALCMLDFIVRGGEAVMIEMTPRPGGDCLPPLILRSGGFDILGAALDFAEGRSPAPADTAVWRPLLGVRMFARAPGRIRGLCTEALDHDPGVLEFSLSRVPGDRVVLPPEDYDSRILGYAIVEPPVADAVERRCAEVAELLGVDMERD